MSISKKCLCAIFLIVMFMTVSFADERVKSMLEDSGWELSEQQAIARILDQARQEEFPVGQIKAKISEGIAKNIPAPQVIRAAEQALVQQQVARTISDKIAPSSGEKRAFAQRAAEVMAAGITANQLRQTMEHSHFSDPAIAVEALGIMRDLALRGAPTEEIAGLAQTLGTQRFTLQEIRELRSEIAAQGRFVRGGDIARAIAKNAAQGNRGASAMGNRGVGNGSSNNSGKGSGGNGGSRGGSSGGGSSGGGGR